MSGEIEAIEARIELAKKAKARTLANLKNAEDFLKNAMSALGAATKEDKEASNDLKAAEDALKDRVINVDEGDGGSDKKRDISLSPREKDKKKNKGGEEVSDDLKAADALKDRVINIDEGDDDSDKKRDVSLSPHDKDKKKPKIGVNILDAKVIEVSGCGYEEANGLYTRQSHRKHGYHVFRKGAKNDGVMEIGVFGFGHGKAWMISEGQRIFYDTSTKSLSFGIDAINDGWEAYNSKSEPTPKLEVKEFI